MGKVFYILAEEPERGVYGPETLCKFGSTYGPVSRRRSEHERKAYRKYDRYAQLEVYFKATGAIVDKERHIRHRTEQWTKGPFRRSMEWRVCYPPKLAEVAMRVAEEGAGNFDVKYICDSRHRSEHKGDSEPNELLLSTYVPKLLYERLWERSEATGRSVGDLVTDALSQYLPE